MIKHGEDFVSICELDDNGEICFTKEYLDEMREVSCETRSFASQFVSHWSDDLKGLLNYFGSVYEEEDRYTGIDGEPMDVVEEIPELWSVSNKCGYPGFDPEWYRDIIRCKLLTAKIPRRIIRDYVKIVKKNKLE